MKKFGANLSKPSKTLLAQYTNLHQRGEIKRILLDAEAAERRAKMAKIRTAKETESAE